MSNQTAHDCESSCVHREPSGLPQGRQNCDTPRGTNRKREHDEYCDNYPHQVSSSHNTHRQAGRPLLPPYREDCKMPVKSGLMVARAVVSGRLLQRGHAACSNVSEGWVKPFSCVLTSPHFNTIPAVGAQFLLWHPNRVHKVAELLVS